MKARDEKRKNKGKPSNQTSKEEIKDFSSLKGKGLNYILGTGLSLSWRLIGLFA